MDSRAVNNATIEQLIAEVDRPLWRSAAIAALRARERETVERTYKELYAVVFEVTASDASADYILAALSRWRSAVLPKEP